MARPSSIDLVVATLGRTTELGRFLDSVATQSFGSVRVIVVDQNGDDRLAAVLAPFAGTLSVCHLHSQPGLSRARNVGMAHLESDLVAFPDDDCWYPPDLLEMVVDLLGDHEDWDGLSTRSTDGSGQPSNMLWDRQAGAIDRFNIWRRAISYSVFLRRSLTEETGGFAEELGVGAGTRWGSGEETDYLLRALEAGFRLHYEPSLAVYHEPARPSFSRTAAAQAFRSGTGNGRVLRLHRYPWWFAFYRVAQLVAGSTFFLVRGRPAEARFYLAMAFGRVRGWLRPG